MTENTSEITEFLRNRIKNILINTLETLLNSS